MCPTNLKARICALKFHTINVLSSAPVASCFMFGLKSHLLNGKSQPRYKKGGGKMCRGVERLERTSTCGEKPWDSNGNVQARPGINTQAHVCKKGSEEEEEEEKAFLDIAQVWKGSVRQGGCGAAARFASIVHAVKNPICRLEGNWWRKQGLLFEKTCVLKWTTLPLPPLSAVRCRKTTDYVNKVLLMADTRNGATSDDAELLWHAL